MPDLSEKKSEVTAAAVEDAQLKDPKKKTCADCGTSKTPLWRGGPAGPMTLCNACGIRSRKKRGAAILGSNKVHHQIKEKKSKKTTTSSSSSAATSAAKSKTAAAAAPGAGGNGKFGLSLNQRLLALGREVLMRRSKIEKQKRMKLGEEEQAAVLLMALSYGSVYA